MAKTNVSAPHTSPPNPLLKPLNWLLDKIVEFMAAFRDWRDGVDKETDLIMKRREAKGTPREDSEKPKEDSQTPSEVPGLGVGSIQTGDGEGVGKPEKAAPRENLSTPKRGASSKDMEWLDGEIAKIGHHVSGLRELEEELIQKEEVEKPRLKAKEVLKELPAVAARTKRPALGAPRRLVVHPVSTLTPEKLDLASALIYEGVKKMGYKVEIEPIMGIAGNNAGGKIVIEW